MGAQTTEGTGHGSAEGPIRGMESVEKILKKINNEAAFKRDGLKLRLDISDNDGQIAADDVIVVPTGNLASSNAQDAFEEVQTDINAANTDIATNASNITTNTTNINRKATKVTSAVSGDFPALTSSGDLANSGKGPDDYYTKAQIDNISYSHQALDDLQGGSGGAYYHLGSAAHSNLTSGTPTFDEITLNNAPTDASDAATKGYVDNAVAGADLWLGAVIDFSTEAAADATNDFRYIASADGATWTENNIYESDGTNWTETVVAGGNATYVTGESSSYLFNGTEWVATGGGVSDHNSLSGLQGGTGGGTPQRYHLNQAAATFAESVNVSSPAQNQRLTYNSATSKWVNSNPEQIYHADSDGTISVNTGLFFVDTSGGDVALVIPDSDADNDGAGILRFFKESSDTNIVTITTIGGQNIGDSTSQTIASDHEGFSVVSDYNGGVGEAWDIIQDSRTASASVAQVVTVAVEGGDFTSVESAISYINGLGDASTSKRYVIDVGPGTYTENAITVPDYVSIMGKNDEATFIKASDNNATFITLGHDSVLYNLRVDGPTNDVGTYTEDEAEIVRCVFQNSLTCVQAHGSSAVATVEETKFKSTCTTGLLATSGSWIGASNIFSQAATNAFYANGGTIKVHNSFSTGATNALYANNGGNLTPHLVDVVGGTNVLRTGATGTNVIHGMGVSADSSSTWHVLQESATGDMHLSGCVLLVTKFSMANAELVRIDFNSDFAGDEGHVLLEELQVGCPEIGRETVLGEGDSYTRGMLVYTETAGNVFADVSTEAASSSGSSFTFPDVTADNAIYVSSDLQDSSDYKQFLGIKSKVTIPAVLGTGEIVAEYWDGTSWTEFNHMSALGSAPYTQQADAIFERAGSEQIRFQDLTLAAASWTKNDPPSTGTNRFWVRFRISTEIDTAPVFEQFKIHSNRTEINADGFVEHMGKARPKRKIYGVNIGNSIELAGAAPKNKNVDYGTLLNFVVQKNQLQSGRTDGFGQIFAIPEGLDTSRALTLRVRWASESSASGNVELRFIRGEISIGTVLNGTNTETTMLDVTNGPFVANKIVETEFEFFEPSLVPQNQVPFAIMRYAGTGSDTLAANVYVSSLELEGYFWS